MNDMSKKREKSIRVIEAIGSARISFYSNGKDYSHLKVNSENYPEHEECLWCGSSQLTITDDADICHDCGYVYI